jgi:hypothetical protein
MLSIGMLLATAPAAITLPLTAPPSGVEVWDAVPRRAVSPVPGAPFEVQCNNIVTEVVRVGPAEVGPVVTVPLVGRVAVVTERWRYRVSFDERVTALAPNLPVPVTTFARRTEVVELEARAVVRLR